MDNQLNLQCSLNNNKLLRLNSVLVPQQPTDEWVQ